MSFRSKTIIGIALIETILLGILVIVGVSWLHDSNEEQFIQRADSLVKLYASNIKDPLLASDLEKLNVMARESITDGGLEYFRILDANGLVLTKVGDEKYHQIAFQEDNDPSKVMDNIYDTGADIQVQDIIYGRIELGLSVTNFQNLLSDARNFGFGMAGLVILLVALFSFALGTYLTAQLSSLALASERISAEGPGFKLPVRGNDELAKVTIAFNHMSESLAATYRELHENAENYRQLSSRLVESDNTKSAILSATLDAVVTIDADGHVLDFNSGAEKIFGYSKEELLGKEMAEHIVPDAYREAHRNGMKHWRNTGEGPVLGARLELVAMRKDGSEFPIEISITPLDIMDKTLFTAFVRDITDQKSAENELKLAASTFDSHEAIFITDSMSRILRVNKAFCDITGYSMDEAIGKTPGQLIRSGLHDGKFYDDIWGQLELSGKWEGEIYNRRKNGEIFPEWVSITAVRDDDGSATHYVAHAIDISQQKQYESELSTAREQAELANNAKSLFLANMSHEIRTPLNAVINLNSLLLDTPLDDKQKNLLNGAYEGGKTLATLVDDILDYTKIEANKVELEYKPFRLHKLLDQISTLFISQAEEKNLEFSVEFADDVAEEVIGDEKRLRQILVNLIGNAIKFTEKGYVKLLVRNDIEKNVQFRVSDTGIGINEGDKSRLFEEFSQADDSTTRKYGGTGLGLSISRSLVKLMKGEIECKKNDPDGSVFWFRIPLVTTRIKRADQGSPIPKFTSTNVLVAEDSISNQVVVRALLEKQGCIVTIANNGKEAVKLASGASFDLVLMDVMMPEMDGIEATKEIRRLEDPGPHIPIIALTANVFSEDREKCLQAGMNDFVAKPIDAEKLIEQIVKWSSQISTPTEGKKSMTTFELMNSETLQKLGNETSPEMLPEIVSIFIKEMDERINSLPVAVDELDGDELIARAHAIKSSAGTFGALRLEDSARRIEQLGRDEKLDEARTEIASMRETGRKTLDLYRQHYPSSGAMISET